LIQDLSRKKLVEGKGHVKLQNAVADIEDRHRDIVKLEKVDYIKQN